MCPVLAVSIIDSGPGVSSYFALCCAMFLFYLGFYHKTNPNDNLIEGSSSWATNQIFACSAQMQFLTPAATGWLVEEQSQTPTNTNKI